MAPRAGVAYAEIVPKLADGFSKDLEKQFTGPVTDSGNKVGSSLGKVAGLIGGAFAAKGIFDFGKSAVEAATESNKIAAQTEAVLKSTGGAAKVTAGQIGDLATAISNKTGIDDEAIQKGQNLLLTFTNLKNGVGKGNDVFNQATKTMVDMGAALGTDASGAAIQLGKALNDPIKGISSLQRVGVTFTDQQKAQIKAMVDSGNQMGAQKVILGELNKEFGGSAEAQATAGDKLAVTWGNVQEQLGNMLLPVLNKVATFLADNLPKAVAFVSGAIDKVKPYVQGLIDSFGAGGLGGALQFLGDRFKAAWPAIQQALSSILSSIGNWVTGTALPWLGQKLAELGKALWEWIQAATPPALQKLGELAAALGKWLLDTGLPLLGEKLVQLGDALWHWIQDATPPALGKLVDLMAQLGSWILNTGLPKLAGFMADMGKKLLDWIADVVPQLPGKLGEFLGKVAAWILTDAVPKMVEMGAKMGDALMGFLIDAAKAAPGKISDVIGAIAGWLKDKGPGLIGDAVKLITAAFEAPFKLLFNTIAGFWNNTLGKASFKTPDWLPGFGGKGLDFPKIPILHQGGVVPGPPGAEVLSLLRAGETVLPTLKASDLRDFTIARDATPQPAPAPVVGEMHFHAANMTAADVSAELAWHRRTSGR